MVRPKCCRRVAQSAADSASHCHRSPSPDAESTDSPMILSLDEFEAIRLADALDLYQDQAAKQMDISRPTFSRIVQSARKKIAIALVNNQTIRIEQGQVTVCHMKQFKCRSCNQVWEQPNENPNPQPCPKCSADDIQSLAKPTRNNKKQCKKGKKCCKKSQKGGLENNPNYCSKT